MRLHDLSHERGYGICISGRMADDNSSDPKLQLEPEQRRQSSKIKEDQVSERKSKAMEIKEGHLGSTHTRKEGSV